MLTPADSHRGRLILQYTDDGTMFKDKVTGLCVHVRKLYGYPRWDVVALRTMFGEGVGATSFNHNPRRRELTEWLDGVNQGNVDA